ncbi:MAG: hypothetical protein QM704_07725 [Anaeromyxobacteraceae bacterium]
MDATARDGQGTLAAPRRRRRWGDRYDGRLLRSLDPLYQLIPYIMKTRSDAQNLFEERIDVTAVEDWLRAQRAAGRNLSFLHVFLAAYIRTISQRPRMNRFIAGRRIYARNEILVSFALKKRLREDSPETVVKLKFEPTATVWDVQKAVDEAIAVNKQETAQNDADLTAKLFMFLPGLVIRFAVWLLTFLDQRGLLPRVIHRVSPFHTSVFVTDLGSLGVRPIYHHLYEFGTTSVFLAFGAKERERAVDEQGNATVRKTIGLKVVTDERICDGYDYVYAFKYFVRLFRHPDELEVPPAGVLEDVA